MKLGHVELFVVDPMRSLAFYRDVLGFEVVAVQREKFVWLRAGEFELLLRPGAAKDGPSSYSDSAAGLVLYTDDLPATLAQLTSRGLVIRGNDGSPECPTFTDPDGHWFQLVNPKHS